MLLERPADNKYHAARAHADLVKKLQTNSNNFLTYTGGSLLKGRAGADTAFYRASKQLGAMSLSLGEASIIFDGEMFMLSSAAPGAVSFAMQSDATCPHLWFFVNNNAMIGYIFTQVPSMAQSHSSYFIDHISDFLLLDDRHHITIAWVLGHEDITGQAQVAIITFHTSIMLRKSFGNGVTYKEIL